MSCFHGNHENACDICDEVDDAFNRGYEAGAKSQRKPLADELIEEIRIKQEFDQWAISEAAFKYAARAIEAAHNIKENT